MLKRIIISILAAGAVFTTMSAAGLSFIGNSRKVLEVEPTAQSGLDAVYVAYGIQGLTIEYTATSTSDEVTWTRYGAMGGAYAEPVEGIVKNGTKWSLANPKADCGYMIETTSGKHYYFWLVDYSSHPFEAGSLEAENADCSSVEMRFEGSAAKISYYSINGRSIDIDREISISYFTQEWNDESTRFETVERTDMKSHLAEHFTLPTPLCTTTFRIEGDQFLRKWGSPVTVVSASFNPVAVDLHAQAEQYRRDNDNEQSNGETTDLGGSAPVEINFKAAVTEAAIFTEWQMARDEEFDQIDYRTQELEFDYTFQEMGTTYVRFVAANADGSCENVSETFTIFVGESSLLCPNAFSPGTTEGVNDTWKVSYKSIIKFECHIFNKWGVKMTEFTDPAQGWDGKYNGKIVPAGVYYYVIKAVGADGRRYDKSGDINIVGYR